MNTHDSDIDIPITGIDTRISDIHTGSSDIDTPISVFFLYWAQYIGRGHPKQGRVVSTISMLSVT